MTEPTDWIKEATEAGVRLKESIHKAHGLLKDLRDLRRELIVMQTTLVNAVGDKSRQAFNEAFNGGLADYTEGLLRQTDAAFERVDKMAEDALADLTANVISKMEETFMKIKAT